MENREFSLFYKEYIERSRSFNVDSTYICPLQCPFCVRQKSNEYQSSLIKQSKHMSMQDFHKVINKADHISFCGQISDPIYSENFLSMLEVLRDKLHTVSIHTTGTRKKLDWWKKAFDLSTIRTRWVFGLDGIDQSSAELHRVNTRFDEVYSVMKLGASMGKDIQWQFIVFEHNQDSIEEAKKLAKDIGVKLIVLLSNRWKTNHPIIRPPSEQWISNSVREQRIIFI